MNIYDQLSKEKSNHRLSKMKMERYFYPKPISTYFVMAAIVGTLLVLVSFMLLFLIGSTTFILVLMLIGLVLFLIGALHIRTVIKSNPTDQDYDDWLAYQVSSGLSRAYRAVNLNESQLTTDVWCTHSIVLPGSSLTSNYGDEICLKQGKDGKWRCSVNLYTYFFPTSHFMAMYTRTIDILNSTIPYNNSTEEYFYRDIISTSFSIFRDTAIIEGEEFWYRVQQLSFKLSSGDTIHIGAYLNAMPIDPKSGAPRIVLPDDHSNQTLANLRALLRSKKLRSSR